MRGDISKALFIDASEVSKNVGIVDLARLVPQGKVIALPKTEFKLDKREIPGLIGTIARHTGRKFTYREDVKTYYLVPVDGEVTTKTHKTAKVKKVTKVKKTELNNRSFERGVPVIRILPQPEYMAFLEEKIARYGAVVVAKAAFKTGKSRVYCVKNLRNMGYLVEGTHAPKVETLKVIGPKGAHTYEKLHQTPVWFDRVKGKTPTTPETPIVTTPETPVAETPTVTETPVTVPQAQTEAVPA